MNQAQKTSQNSKITITGAANSITQEILSGAALDFLESLHEHFNARRLELLAARTKRQAEFDAGVMPDFLPETQHIREGDWRVAPIPADLQDRRVEITGPVDRKMVINALNSGAKCFMADFEDATSPTWENVIEGQLNVRDALRGTIALETGGKSYTLRTDAPLAKLLVRPRGWHLPEKHLTINGAALSGSLVDFGFFVFHNHETVRANHGLYFYLPKLESHLEARLWNDVFTFAEDHFDLKCGSLRATVLIETITAAFEMDEILYELRDHSIGLNAGRWDYIFSAIKKFRNRDDMILPDRADVKMTAPFMSAYANLLVKTCHKRGTFAMGGMAAFIPSRKDSSINETAFTAVRADKEREAGLGFDGTWVAHPDLIPLALEKFDAVLGSNPNQISRQRDDVQVTAADLLNFKSTPGAITLKGVRLNIDVALQYINAWLGGLGAVAIHNLMEDAATAEISRAQLWQWIKNNVTCDDETPITAELYKMICAEELQKLKAQNQDHYDDAASILDTLVLSDHFEEFLTLPAYEKL
jgi:malate synthase